MLRNIIVAAVTVVVLALGITFQILGTTSHEVKDGSTESSLHDPSSSR